MRALAGTFVAPVELARPEDEFHYSGRATLDAELRNVRLESVLQSNHRIDHSLLDLRPSFFIAIPPSPESLAAGTGAFPCQGEPAESPAVSAFDLVLLCVERIEDAHVLLVGSLASVDVKADLHRVSQDVVAVCQTAAARARGDTTVVARRPGAMEARSRLRAFQELCTESATNLWASRDVLLDLADLTGLLAGPHNQRQEWCRRRGSDPNPLDFQQIEICRGGLIKPGDRLDVLGARIGDDPDGRTCVDGRHVGDQLAEMVVV